MDSKQNISENLSNTRENDLHQENASFSRFTQGINDSTSTESTSKILPGTSRRQLFRKLNKESFNLDKESELSGSFKYSLNLQDQSSKLLNLREGNHSSRSQFSSDLPFGRNYKGQYCSSFSSHDEFPTSRRIRNVNDSVNNYLFQEPNASSHLNSHFLSLAESPIPYSPHPREFLAPVLLKPYKETIKSQNEIPISYNYSQNPLERKIWFNESPRTHYYQPSPIRRPIVGRQLMTKTDNVEIKMKPFYELYPSENDKFKAQSVPPMPTTFFNISPTANMNQFTTTMPTTFFNIPPTANMNQFTTTMPTTFFNIPPTANMNQFTTTYTRILSTNNLPNDKLCTLCRKNGETVEVYSTHYLKKMIGNRKIVTCPILRALVCTICGVSGDNAHTITYCPVLRESNNGQPLQSTTVILRNTRLLSNGRRRF